MSNDDDRKTKDLLKKLLSTGASGSDNESKSKLPLEELAASYMKKEKFEIGDTVVFKEGMRHVKFPKYEQECIVMEILDPPVIDMTEEHIGTPYYREKHDFRLGLLAPDGDFVMMIFDGNRFEKVKKKKKN